MTHHTYAEVRLSCEHDILIVTTPSRRPYHVVSTEGKRSLPLMYRPIRNSTWVIASCRLPNGFYVKNGSSDCIISLIYAHSTIL